ncbi:tRNA dihydrouridine synthase DusB [Boudabousia marimammalium]|uniref:tRNA-dihydrouridine synthase n=1 Tax=Boudabousia marimammalium TaxID=156892 RepID=A0A1Q5PPE2_9ACTO|nr:tRNA dihydrouridine synthase DusB [Boudabousia marimammalium]OKL49389.1 tRNA dihydrouridine synthase DusB [Boudabousia marimammalium]
MGRLQLWVPVILAPMAGVTNAPFRRLCREAGEAGLSAELAADLPKAQKGIDAPAGLYVSEMITSRALVEETPETMRMITPDPTERVRSIQLYGVDPATMRQAAQMLCERDLADHIDMNFGCPVPKVTRKGGGAALPWKHELFAAIVQEVVAAAKPYGVPVTVKMRTGIDDDHMTFERAALLAQDAGIDAVALHARTAAQHYSGQAHWDQIGRLVEMLDIPVLGNGDVFEADDAVNMMEDTGCAGIVVGRGCQGRPWIFTDLTAALAGSKQRVKPDLQTVAEMILEHADLMIAEFGSENRAMREMRKHISWYLRGYAIGGPQRHALHLVSTKQELQDRLDALDLTQAYPEAAQGKRGRAGGEKRPHLPEGWLDSPELNETQKLQLADAEIDASGG